MTNRKRNSALFNNNMSQFDSFTARREWWLPHTNLSNCSGMHNMNGLYLPHAEQDLDDNIVRGKELCVVQLATRGSNMQPVYIHVAIQYNNILCACK